jgi:hypothetical protein
VTQAFYNPSAGRWLNRESQIYGLGNYSENGLESVAVAAKQFSERGRVTCDFTKPPGTPMPMTINNSTCTRQCTIAHEAQHLEDRQEWCDKGRAAYQAAGANRAQVGQQLTEWWEASSAWAECRAYTEEGKCLDSLWNASGCKQCYKNYKDRKKPSKNEIAWWSSCCVQVQRDMGDNEDTRKSYCSKPEAKSMPPFPFR